MKAKSRTADVWFGMSARGALYARTAAGAYWLCRLLCDGHRAKLTPTKCIVTIPPKRRSSRKAKR